MKAVFKGMLYLVAFLIVTIVALRVIFALPDVSDRAYSSSIPASADTTLGARMEQGASQNPGLSGVIPLADGQDALVSRLALADRAEHSIDAQYYIWHNDVSGILLLDALHRAAQRGVRVRLLLDDNGVPGLDGIMATLNAQENFEIRLFNPSTIRTPKLLGYSFDFFRMNRRMHNKSFLVDGAAAIIGGRNIGDEYFSVGEDIFYADMDVLATGPIVGSTADLFDDYWNSMSVHALETIVDSAADLPSFDARVEEVKAAEATAAFETNAKSSAVRYAQAVADMEWTVVQLVADDPIKGLGIASRDQLMITRLSSILGQIENQLDLVSAYFVPGRQGTKYFTDLAEAGLDVRILTNALNTTDVLLVHAGYTKYRRDLLESGVSLYELKLRGNMTTDNLRSGPLGLSGASLHAKTFAVDDKRMFIGSFNFDPRSAMLNCEMGFLIDSPEMARKVRRTFEEVLPSLSYRTRLTPEGKMIWQEERDDGEDIIYQEEPGATWAQQIALVVIGWLPVEWML